MPAAVHLTFAVLFPVLVEFYSWNFLRFILHVPRVTVQVLEAGISTYVPAGRVVFDGDAS